MRSSLYILPFLFLGMQLNASEIATIPANQESTCKEGFLPLNSHYIPVSAKPRMGGVTEEEFNSVLDRVTKVYTPLVRKFGGNLQIQRLWTDGTVNASANQQGSNYIIKMYGGLARHSTITKDAFALVACHEVGHHIGGAPKYTAAGNGWAAVEGQADYFATSKCLRKLFLNDDNQQIISSMNIDPMVITECDSQFQTDNEAALCKRISMAGLSSASLFAAMNNERLPRFETPDPAVVRITFESHPQFQCRLDTYFQGAVCEVDDDTDIGQNDPNTGTCNRVDRHAKGLRPLCWFKPQTTTNPNPNPNPTPIGGVSPTPSSNGQSSVTVSNPNTRVPIYFDVSSFKGAVGMAIEVSREGRRFQNPNGVSPDRVNGLGVKTFRITKGVYQFIARNELPGFGVYQIRVIGLDQQQKPVSKFSNTFSFRVGR
jgi:hypothetical protein